MARSECPHGPCVDPTFQRRPRAYADFVQCAAARGMVGFRRADGDRGRLGLFFVAKKGGKLRVFFDTRVVNCFFQDAPRTRLPTSSAMAGLDSCGFGLSVAGGDLGNAFYRLQPPEGLQE